MSMLIKNLSGSVNLKYPLQELYVIFRHYFDIEGVNDDVCNI